MAKGDRIYIGIRDTQNGAVSGIVEARQNGRSVKSETVKENNINWLVVQEITRGGTIVEEIKVQLNDVILIKTSKGE